jgi:tetratricopeptide (TPR) repeat protein
MKIKTLYLYGGIAVLAVAFLIYFTAQNNEGNPENLSIKEMPDDDLHKGLNDPPGKENVSGEIRHHMEVLKKEVDENPDDTLKMREYADLLASAHKQEEAVIYYYNILNINPRRTDILSSLAFIYFNKNDFTKAKDVVEKILLYEPGNTEAIYNLGAIAASAGKKEEARKIWEELLNKYPDSNEAKLAENSLKKL